jgi:hypothetical protein
MTRLSPVQVEVLLYQYYSGDDNPKFLTTPAHKEALALFLELRVFEHHNDPDKAYHLSDLGRAWVEAILRTPMPVRIFVDPRDLHKILKDHD